MSVLIINMEMPNTCKACVCSNYYERMDMILCDIMDKQLDEKQWKSERHHDCPLIEVPTPHGRLIDADALIADLVKYQNTLDPESRENARVLSVKSYLTLARGEAIIEAED